MNHITLSTANCQVSGNQITFDINITNDGDGVETLSFLGTTFRMLLNKGIIPSGSTINPAYAGGSDFPACWNILYPSAGATYNITYDATKGMVTCTTSAADYNRTTAIVIQPNTTMKMGTFTFTLSTGNFVSGQNVGLAWNTTSGVVLYVNSVSTNFNSNTNRTLATTCVLTTL